MQQLSPDTAILLFARTAEAEAQHKHLSRGRGASANYRLLKTLVHHAEDVAQQSGLPVFHISELEQHGNSFGERLHHAFEQVYAQGFERVIAIGSDCAHLTPGMLATAAQQLHQQGMVLGPARDGGVYLLGLQQNAFARMDFSAIDWRTGRVCKQLQNALPSAAMLRILSDIDHTEDLCRVLLSGSLPAKLLRALSAFAPGNPVHVVPVQERALSTVDVRSARSRRGPPKLA